MMSGLTQTENLSFTTIDPILCPVCGKPTAGLDQFCSKKCRHKKTNNRARAKDRKLHDVQFIGVDGEGVNIQHADGTREHRYVMLSVGDQTLWENGRELTHLDIFPFLYDQFLENPSAVYVGFFLGYDFTMWLKSLSENEGFLLFNKDGILARKLTAWARKGNPVPRPVVVGDWEIDILGMRRFKIRPRRKTAKGKVPPWMFVCDTGQYWQTSFLSAIDPSKWTNGNQPCTPDEYETIKEGKSERGTWVDPYNVSYFHDMVKYNKLENEILARVMRILNRGFVEEGIYLDRDQYYGPGQAAQAWLDTKFDNAHWMRRKNLMEIISPEIADAFKASYYGGWFEPFYIGHVPGNTYEYDKRSAYPDAMRYLPCLCSADGWEIHEGPALPVGTHSATIALVYGTFEDFVYGDSDVGPLPHRIGEGPGQGKVVRPAKTRGWYLLSEVEAAKKAGLIMSWELERTITYHKTCNHRPPLAILAKMYEKRKEVGKNTPHGKALKLILNSMYGKFAQSIGNPKYGNPIYATMITAHCRVAMLEAIATHPRQTHDLVMIATDGIYFRTRHPSLDRVADNDVLGGWEAGIKKNLTVMKAGVYWDDEARKRDGKINVKSRGISAKALQKNIPDLDATFTEFYSSGLTTPLPEIELVTEFAFVSPRLASARGKWRTAGRVVWEGDPEAIRTDRAVIEPKRAKPYISGKCIRTFRPRGTANYNSQPYTKDFGFTKSVEDRELEELITESGNIVSDFRFALDLAHDNE